MENIHILGVDFAKRTLAIQGAGIDGFIISRLQMSKEFRLRTNDCTRTLKFGSGHNVLF